MTVPPTTVAPAADPGTGGIPALPGRHAARARAKAVASQVRQSERDAAERRRQARLDADGERRDRHRAARAERHREASKALGEMLAKLGTLVAERFTDLMFAPLILVPGWLGWDAMSGFGGALYGTPGKALPVLSETGMWLFDFAVIRARKRDPRAVVWHLYAGMAVFAGICAVLNFLHGKAGPIPGSISPGAEAGTVYALVSVSGIVAHQILKLGARTRKAADRGAKAGRQRRAVGPPVGPSADAAFGPLRQWLFGPLARALGLPVGPVGGQDGAAVITAERDRLAKENSELRRKLTEALRGNPETPDNDEDDGSGAADSVAYPGGVQAVMRAYWDKETAAGRIPSGADLNRAAGKAPKYSLGKTRAAEWRLQLPPDHPGKSTGGQPGKADGDESTSTALAGAR